MNANPATKPFTAAAATRRCSCGGHLTREIGIISAVFVDPRTGKLFRRETLGAFLACDSCEQVSEEARA